MTDDLFLVHYEPFRDATDPLFILLKLVILIDNISRRFLDLKSQVIDLTTEGFDGLFVGDRQLFFQLCDIALINLPSLKFLDGVLAIFEPFFLVINGLKIAGKVASQTFQAVHSWLLGCKPVLYTQNFIVDANGFTLVAGHNL